mgnify:CR=1 FL=1
MTFSNFCRRVALPAASLATIALTGCNPEPVTPDNEGIALRTFQTCDGLEAYIEDAILETLVRNSGGYGWAVDDAVDADGSPEAGGSDEPTDYTTTNNQEEGVDELDIVKTNGTHIFSVDDGEVFITKSWPIEDTALLASVEIGGYARGLFLEGDTLVVASQRYNYEDGDAFTSRSWSSTRLTFIDISEPDSPAVTREVDLEGYLADGRLIDGKGYFVVNAYMPIPEEFWDLVWNGELDLPVIDWEDSEEVREVKRNQIREILRPHVEEMAESMDLTSFLPLMRDQYMNRGEAPIEPIHSCTDLYRPANVSQYSVLSIVEVDIAGDGDIDSSGLLSDGWQVYASQDNLYVSQTSWWWWWGGSDLDLNTHIHQFALSDTGPVYTGSGEVEGWLLDQFSFSEYDGHLRVATTDIDWWWGTGAEEDEEEAANNLFVLENQDLVDKTLLFNVKLIRVDKK